MKKLLSIIMVVFALTVGMTVAPETLPHAQAMEYDQYWNGDTNYPLVYGHMGVAKYLDSSSVIVKQNIYDGQNIDRIWAENIISVDGTGNIQTMTFWYRDYCSTMYFRSNNNDWREFDPWSPYGYMQTVAIGCKLGWEIAFGSTFI